MNNSFILHTYFKHYSVIHTKNVPSNTQNFNKFVCSVQKNQKEFQ